MPDTPLNPDALEAGAQSMECQCSRHVIDCGEYYADCPRHAHYPKAVSAYLAVAQPEVNSAVEAFINERPEYITALKNTRGTDDQSDYWRWQGHAESRRQLAQALGWTVPHNPGETTRPEVKP